MDMASRIVAAALALLMGVIALSACSVSEPPLVTWSGTSTSEGVDRSLTLEARRSGDQLEGEYTVDAAATGAFDGTIDGEALTASLRPSGDCTYAFEGTLVDGVIEGTYAPDACPGGASGTWRLERP